MRAALAAVALALALAGCGSRARPEGSLAFARRGADGKTVEVAELVRELPSETISMDDPYYRKRKTFRAIPLRRVLEKGFGDVGALSSLELVMRAKDGYAVPFTFAKATEDGAYLAWEDAEVPGWEPIGPQRASPGPLYLVWKNPEQQDLETHPRPWQLATIEAARFEDVYPHLPPKGEPDGSAAWRGFATFRKLCVACHAVNREGGRVGPDLNVPKSIVEYRPEEQIKAYIKDPRAFRYGNMPAHEGLSEAELDELVAYFRAMKDRKHE